MQLEQRSALPSTVPQSRSLAVRHWFERAFLGAFAWLATTVYWIVGDWRGWLPLLTRTSAHLAIVAVTFAAIALSGVEWPAQAASNSSVSVLFASAENRQGEN
ncbi:MAG: hypothetical protein U9R15_11775, partial [Chloroflexota bacterium]|nr:hypothetical protein [Chloroflexota bacterium]